MHSALLSLATALLQGPPFPPDMQIPYEAVQLVQSFFVTIVVIALGIPIIRALTRRFVDRAPIAPPLPTELTTRLERIEQAVDAIAIEVERVSEAQRYQTRLMSESRALGAGNAEATSPSGQRKDTVR